MNQQVKLFYEAPTTEVVEVQTQGNICIVSPTSFGIMLGMPSNPPDDDGVNGLSDYEGESLVW